MKKSPTKKSSVKKPPIQKAPKLLVVDDQDLFRNMLSAYLRQQGFEVLEASTGEGALEMTHLNKFDGILMDVRMPETDGITALKKMQENGVKTPVILMSGFGDVKSVEDAKAIGAENFLAKPFKLQAAATALGKFLDAIHLP